ncbi:DUF6153 family protein [Streptomyces ipomoeae]|uniref:DUF6153 family protein n=1 Tax=Streptomyces ipomoeae TaxID=103232 RepID=UPI001146D3A3|nr:DUF6153 family protein [Streptomyces ipomoeae]TQE39541.1 hypothetical protein Sipo7851_03315 [Streptomyces ipomoeae]
MSVNTRPRAGGALGHLLLVVVLAFGVFAMHTMGHPEDSSGSGMGGGAHAPVVDSPQDPVVHEAGSAAPRAQSAVMTAHVSEFSGASPSADEPFTGMDMMSLCMAVLGAWLFAMCLREALARRPAWSADLLARSAVLARPNPPSRRPDLAQLSVLRI